MVKCHKKKSKRMTCSKRYKIIKKVAEHNRKLRKERKNAAKRKPKDPGVPNSLPFKDDILREAELRKQQAKDLKEAQKASRKKIQSGNLSLNEMVQEAVRMDNLYEKEQKPIEKLRSEKTHYNSSYFKELKQVVENADVILEVLDARDPLGSRCPQIEELVISSAKKLVLVLNKIDLIPRDNLNAWLKYLRQSLPTVAFKASTQSQSSNLSRSKIPVPRLNEDLQSTSHCFGASFLMKVLGNYCRNNDIQTFIKVGVVGFPNVGKSSVINSLKRCRSCAAGSTPGLTKAVQEVSLDKHIKILDSPGVVLARGHSPTTLALRNAVRLETLKDVLSPAEAIVQRADRVQLCMHYTLPEFSSCDELFNLLAKRSGKFKKGGAPNAEEGARRLIRDWNRGFIKYYTHPPEVFQPDVYLASAVVAEMSKAFDISELEEGMELDRAPEMFARNAVVAKSTGPTEGMVQPTADEEKMEEDGGDKSTTVEFKSKKKNKKKLDDEFKGLEPHHQMNTIMKKKFKKQKKQKKRAEKLAQALSSTLDAALSL